MLSGLCAWNCFNLDRDGSRHPLQADRSGTIKDDPRRTYRSRPTKLLPRLKPLQFLLKSTLARNTGWMLFGQGLRLVIQALYFAMIARSLGTSGYGAFV